MKGKTNPKGVKINNFVHKAAFRLTQMDDMEQDYFYELN